MRKILQISHVEKYYGTKENVTKALDKVSLEVDYGEFVGIMGASGSGKTTLLNCISTIDKVNTGSIIIDNTDINEISDADIARFRRETLGFIFQDFNLLDTLTIEENIALALTINHTATSDIDEKVKEISKKLGIYEILQKFPYEISGGQKQRCACARALINSPKLILADEPTGALDSKSAKVLLETMRKMNEELAATILMVTHDPFSASYSKRILFFRDGRILNELNRGGKTRQQFYHEIIDVLSLVGGDTDVDDIG